MTKRTKITFIAVVAAIIFSVSIFAAVRHNYADIRYIGGEGALLLLPLITYVACKNITTSLDVFHDKQEDNIEEYQNQMISCPVKLVESKPRLEVVIGNQTAAVANKDEP